MKTIKRLLITVLVIIGFFGAVAINEQMNTGGLFSKRMDGKIVGIQYSYGSFNGGYYDYKLTDENGKAHFVAQGGNGVELNIDKEVDPSVLEKLAEIINDYGIYRWDGFNKSDDDILDGFSFSLEVIYDDGKSIHANGYMKYPQNFDVCDSALTEVFVSLCE